MLIVLPQADPLIIKNLLISIVFVYLTVVMSIVRFQADHQIVTKQLMKRGFLFKLLSVYSCFFEFLFNIFCSFRYAFYLLPVN